MTQEEKLLLLQDLCARLPYDVKVQTPYNDAILAGIINRKGVRKDIDYIDIATDKQTYPIRYIKPYLRPMSSMTEEEWAEYDSLSEACKESGYYDVIFDWLNSHHLDYRHLIEKGLALEAPRDMYAF